MSPLPSNDFGIGPSMENSSAATDAIPSTNGPLDHQPVTAGIGDVGQTARAEPKDLKPGVSAFATTADQLSRIADVLSDCIQEIESQCSEAESECGEGEGLECDQDELEDRYDDLDDADNDEASAGSGDEDDDNDDGDGDQANGGNSGDRDDRDRDPGLLYLDDAFQMGTMPPVPLIAPPPDLRARRTFVPSMGGTGKQRSRRHRPQQQYKRRSVSKKDYSQLVELLRQLILIRALLLRLSTELMRVSAALQQEAAEPLPA